MDAERTEMLAVVESVGSFAITDWGERLDPIVFVNLLESEGYLIVRKNANSVEEHYHPGCP